MIAGSVILFFLGAYRLRSLLGLAWALGHTTIQTWMTDAVADSRATGMSFFSISLFIGASIGSALGNVAASSHGFAALFFGSATASVFFAAAASLARARYRVREEHSTIS